MNIAALLIIYKYPLLFVGTLFLGEIVFIPAAFLAKSGVLSVLNLFIVANVANMVTDIAWYFLLRFVPLEKIRKWHLIESRKQTLTKVTKALDTYGYRLLFISKFLYGTRILLIVASSLRRLPFFSYFLVSSLGTFVYLGFLYYIVTVAQAAHSITQYKAVATAVFIGVVIIYIWLQRYLTRKLLSQQSN